jgi:hypothetical protein
VGGLSLCGVESELYDKIWGLHQVWRQQAGNCYGVAVFVKRAWSSAMSHSFVPHPAACDALCLCSVGVASFKLFEGGLFCLAEDWGRAALDCWGLPTGVCVARLHTHLYCAYGGSGCVLAHMCHILEVNSQPAALGNVLGG